MVDDFIVAGKYKMHIIHTRVTRFRIVRIKRTTQGTRQDVKCLFLNIRRVYRMRKFANIKARI